MVLDRLEAILNRNVADSRRAQSLARRLDARAISLAVEGTPLTIFLRAEGGRLALTPRHDGPADATISGTPMALLALAGPRAEGTIRGGGVRIEGDAEVAQHFRELLAEARPDFEEELSRVVGDVAAHHLANTARGMLDFGRRAADTFARNMGEYLTEESRDLPAQPEVEAWIEQVDRLREDADRLEARLALLGRSRRGGGA